MRRLLVTLFAAGLLGTVLAGCRHVAGVCDCDYLDPCYTRAPWAGEGLHGALPPFNGLAPAEGLKVAPRPEKGN